MEWINNLLFLLGGAALGAVGVLAYHFLITRHSDLRIRSELREMQDEFTKYRENVNAHFSQTTDLVNNLTESFVAIHKHITEGADTLSAAPRITTPSPQEALGVETKAADKELDNESPAARLTAPVASKSTPKKPTEAVVEPPRDYAPKTSPNEVGTLSEDFGLKKTSN